MTNNLKLIIGGIIASLIVVIGGAILLSASDKPVEREKLGTASLEIDKTAQDLGTMKSDEEKTAEFIITNTSNNPLRIWKVNTSCDCTFVTFKIGGKEAGEFNMHQGAAMRNWMGEVPVGSKAILTVIYRPKIMPVVGKVNRQVSFANNDPKNENVEVSISANVL